MGGVLRGPRAGAWQLVFLAFAWLGPGLAQAQSPSEVTVKAAFLYKFAGYVDWPPSSLPGPDTPYVIGVMGADDVAAELDRLTAGRQVNGRRVIVRRVADAAAAREVHIFFAGRNEARLREVMRALQRTPVLTVTDADGGLDAGAIVALLRVGDHVGFEVSSAASERAGLAISSRMLGVARRVVTG